MSHENWSFAALQALPVADTNWIIEPVVAPNSMSVFYGPREAGKTQLILTLFQAMQENAVAFGHFPCRRAKAVLVELDMPKTVLQMRVQSMPRDLFDPDLFMFQTFEALPNVLNCNRTTPWVRDINAFQPAWVVFDSLRKLHHLKDEAPEAPSAVYGKLQELFPGVARSVLHHVRKPPPAYLPGAKEYSQTSDPNAYRGTTAWLDDADAAIYMPYNPKTRERAVWVTRSRLIGEDAKDVPVAVELDEDTLLLRAAKPSPQVHLAGWLKEHPEADQAAAIRFAESLAAGKSRATYYRWVQHARLISK